jgi:hypothetical protein
MKTNNYQIGDLVSVKYCHVENDTLRFRYHTGIVTDYGGDVNGALRRSYKVLTLDGKHDWSPRDDLSLVRPLKL